MVISIGDVFEDLDPRMIRCNILAIGPARRRRVKVIDIETHTHRLVVEDIDTRTRTRIRHDRLSKGGSRGFRRVEAL